MKQKQKVSLPTPDLHDLIGKPFRYGGRGRNPHDGTESYDCYGLVCEIYKRRGITLPPLLSAIEYHKIDPLFHQQKEAYKRIEQPEPFCIVSFIIRPPYVSHIGVVLQDGKRFMHILKKRAVTIEPLSSPSWNHRIEGFYQWTE